MANLRERSDPYPQCDLSVLIPKACLAGTCPEIIDRIIKGPEDVKNRPQMNSHKVDDLQCFYRRSSAFLGGTTGLFAGEGGEMRKGSTRKPQADEPATQGKNYITPSGLQRLKDEHRFLLTRDRPAVTEVVTWAASNGDRSENADYQYG
jgi:hypothetical protein